MSESGIDILQMYRGLAQHLPNTSVVLYDKDMRYLLAEGPNVDMMMPPGVEIIGKRPEELLPPEFVGEIVAIQDRTLHGETFNFEQTYPLGSYHSYANPIRDENGDIIGGMIVTHDVTEANRAKTALRASEALFHSLVNLIPVGIIQTDVEGNRVFCNTAWCEMTGVTLEEALGDVNYGTIHPDDLDVASESWVRMMETNQPFQNAVFRYLRPDGTSVWVSGNGTPLRDQNGTVTGYLGSVTNISDVVNMQTALKENEARYRMVVNTMSEGLILQGRDGSVQAINPAAERIIGLTAQEMMEYNEDSPKWPLIHEDGSPFPNHDLPLAVTLRTGEPQTNVMIGMRTPDRSLRWISTSSRPVFTGKGPLPDAALVTMNDVTDLQEVHARLQQERDLLRAVIDNTPEYVFLKDREGKFVLGNVSYAHALGKASADEIIGKTVGDFWPPDIAAQYIAEDERVMETGVPILRDEQKNASRLGGHRYVTVTKIPLRNPQGDISGMLGVIADITKRKEMENEIRNNEERLRLITDNIQDLVMQQTPEGVIMYASESARTILGYDPATLVGSYGPDLVHPDDRNRMLAMGYAAWENGAESVTLESRSRHKDGHYVPLESVTRFIYDAQGNYFGNVSISRDVTERNRLQEVSLEREKLETALEKELELGALKTRMMQRIAHEFRTPLTVIQSSVETMTVYLDRMTPEQRIAKKDMIVGQIEWITDMLDQIGLVLHGSFRPSTIKPARVDASGAVREVAEELEGQMKRPGRFELDLPESAAITVDADLLKTALSHVMRNAVRFSEPKPVRVCLRKLDKGVEFRIVDAGIGILPVEQGRIFDPFFRGSNINEVGGIGVGLTLARSAVEALNGSIAVQSAPKQGTTMTLWIPDGA